MFSIARLVLVVGLFSAPIGLAHAEPPAQVSVAQTLSPADFDAEQLLVLHYHRPDGKYDRWNAWVWPDGGDGGAYPFDQPTEYGRYAVVPLDAGQRAGFIVRLGEWEAKDVDGDRFTDLEADGVTEIYLVAGDPTVYGEVGEIDLTLRVQAAFLDDANRISLATTAPLSDEQIDALTVDGYEVSRVVTTDRPAIGGLIYDVMLASDVAAADLDDLTVALPDLKPVTVFARNVLDAYAAPEAELGSRHGTTATTFRTWSPVSDSVNLLIFDKSDGSARSLPMTQADHVWSVRVPGDLHGKQYQFEYNRYGETVAAPDIHGYAATEDSTRSVVVDLARTNPENWGNVPAPVVQRKVDEIIYEIHVRDFSIADESAPENIRGTYLGLVHENETPVKTGLSHLKELGITAVHLLPVQDYSNERHDYNWGYWTALFNVPEAGYATDPTDPLLPIRELKTAIQKLHENDIRVILDVVYNHTSTPAGQAAFDASAPKYYFRTTDDGRYRNDAGTGNSIADERVMARKYIVDSLVYWTEEYDIDGFRFDLLGTHTPQTVDALLTKLESVRDDLTIYGEPWTGGGPLQYGKGAQRGSEMAVFNDHLRNAIRGDLDGTAVGFATGPGGNGPDILTGVRGAIDDFADEPIESVNYASAHDNLTLWDKIAITAPDADEATHRRMQKLALGIVLTSQGMPFLHGGSDFARTKLGEHNSYNKGDEINKFDWARKAEYRDVFDYVAGLIEVRRAHPAFRMWDDVQVRRNLRVLSEGPVVAFALNGAAVGDPWGTIVVAYNGEPTEQSLDLPPGQWTQVANETDVGTEPLGTVEGKLTLPGYSMAILWR